MRIVRTASAGRTKGWGLNHGKKERIDVRDAANQDQLFFTQITIRENKDEDVHLV